MKHFLFLILTLASVCAQIQPVVDPYRFSTANPSAATLTNGLVAYYRLDETSGTRTNNFDGTHNLDDFNTVTSNPGIITNSAQFTRANSEYLRTAAAGPISGTFTLMSWIYIDATGTTEAVWNQGGGGFSDDAGLFWRGSSSKLEFLIADPPPGSGGSKWITNSTALSASTWYMVICSNNNTNDTLSISVNNGGDSQNTTSVAWSVTAHGFFWLGREWNVGNYWGGRIDEVAIWNRILTPDEITYLYNGGAGRPYVWQ